MSRRFRAPLALLVAGLVLAGATHTRTSPADAPSPGEVAYGTLHAVLLSPRCRNCHPQGDAPLHGDDGAPHSMNVSRASPPAGLPCTTCHRTQNGKIPGSPPGVPNWHMPPKDMPLVFEGKRPRELCEQLKDPTRNGGRVGDAVIEHLRHDPLVLWAWAPGPGRAPPPVSHAAVVKAAQTWVEAGMPCPP